MERSILNESFRKADVEAYVNRKREQFLKRLFWQKFFPLKYTTQLTWESLTGSHGSPVMADVIEYNASAPLKTRRVVTKTTGDIPKIAIKRQMDEKDYNEYNTLKALARGDESRNALLDLVFGDIDFCYTGVMSRTEYLAMQALSYGVIALTTSNNNGIITEANCDFGVPAANKGAVALQWSQASGATPLDDIRTIVDNQAASGYTYEYMVMDKTALGELQANTQVKEEFSVLRNTDITSSKPMLSEMNRVLEARLLPKIIVVDSMARFENAEHSLTNVAAWKTGYVTFIPELRVGNILHGPIAEETSPSVSKKALQVKRDHILLSKWSELEPFGEFTKGQANAFPRFTDVDSLFMLKVDATTWS
uniref:Putative capsid protein n=1 Tax=viral metagenome TaxID=1070528 RepID=A0A6M3JUI2_9ZZZZ